MVATPSLKGPWQDGVVKAINSGFIQTGTRENGNANVNTTGNSYGPYSGQ